MCDLHLCFLEKVSAEMRELAKYTFDADTKLLNFTEKLKTASGKYLLGKHGYMVISAICCLP